MLPAVPPAPSAAAAAGRGRDPGRRQRSRGRRGAVAAGEEHRAGVAAGIAGHHGGAAAGRDRAGDRAVHAIDRSRCRRCVRLAAVPASRAPPLAAIVLVTVTSPAEVRVTLPPLPPASAAGVDGAGLEQRRRVLGDGDAAGGAAQGRTRGRAGARRQRAGGDAAAAGRGVGDDDRAGRRRPTAVVPPALPPLAASAPVLIAPTPLIVMLAPLPPAKPAPAPPVPPLTVIAPVVTGPPVDTRRHRAGVAGRCCRHCRCRPELEIAPVVSAPVAWTVIRVPSPSMPGGLVIVPRVTLAPVIAIVPAAPPDGAVAEGSCPS